MNTTKLEEFLYPVIAPCTDVAQLGTRLDLITCAYMRDSYREDAE